VLEYIYIYIFCVKFGLPRKALNPISTISSTIVSEVPSHLQKILICVAHFFSYIEYKQQPPTRAAVVSIQIVTSADVLKVVTSAAADVSHFFWIYPYVLFRPGSTTTDSMLAMPRPSE
jgi:hypothetical protein